MTPKNIQLGEMFASDSSEEALRQRAEAVLSKKNTKEDDQNPGKKSFSPNRTIHDFEVHQIELELQNTELRNAQAEIEAARHRYFDLYDLAPVGYVTLNSQGGILESNYAAAILLGVSRRGLVKQLITKFIHPEDQATYDTQCKKVAESRLPQVSELRMMGRDQKWLWARLEATIAKSSTGVSEFRIILTNITERKRAEEALNDSVEFSSSLIRFMQDGFSVLDLEGTVLDVNLALCEMTGFAREELVGCKAPHPYWPSEEHPRIQEALDKTLRGQSAAEFELTFMRKDGTRFPVIVSAFAVKDRNGETINYSATVKNITARKHAQQALEASESFQKDILNSLPAQIAVLDSAGIVVSINEPWMQFAGVNGNSRGEKIGVGANYVEVCQQALKDNGHYAKEMIEGLLAVLSGKQTRFYLEYPLVVAGSNHWFAMEILVPASRGTGAIVTHTDISERRKAEEALHDANQKLRLHFEQTPMAVIEWDLDSRVTNWNPAAQTIFGYTREEAIGQHASFIVPQEFGHLVDGVFRALLTKSGGERSTNPNVNKNGSPVLCEWYNTALIDEHGKVAGVASVVVDMTEQTETLDLLEWEKNALELIGGTSRLQPVLDQLMISLEKQLPGALCSVLLLDEDGVHLRHGAAPSLPDVYNLAVDGMKIGQMAGSCGTAAYEKRQVIVTDIHTDPLWEEFREIALEQGLKACWSTPIYSHGNVIGTFAIYSHQPRRPALRELELIERAVHVVRIAIDRKHAEEEIRLLHSSLERRVEERTAELEAANQELEAFTYSVSHDLRAPLRAVDGFSRMVIDDCAESLDGEGQRMLGVIRYETQRMGRLIDDLLAFSRLGRLPIERAPIDMQRLAQDTFDELVERDSGNKSQLKLHPLAPAHGSEALVRQVWVNLISNALKFSQNCDVPQIEIGTQIGSQRETIYYVKDSGVGFEMRHSGKLFGIFQRLHSQQEFPGTGVGLALVQRIVERHGGKVWAESEPGRGATFFFVLPNPNPC